MSSNLSRRNFIRLTAGALTTLPRIVGVPGAFLLATAPATAYANEADNASEGYDPAHVVVIDPDELGIQTYDVASGLALKDAHVTVTSYAEGAKTQTIEGDTDASGVWVSNVADLCEPDGLALDHKSYEFYARIDVQKDGYRPFTTALVRVVAGQGLAVSTQPIDAGKPYPHIASFNEFDILYTANEFIRSSANDSACTLELYVDNMDATGNVTAELYQDDAPLGIKGSFGVEKGTVHVQLQGVYLLADGAESLQAGAGFSMHLSYATAESSSMEMIVPLNMVVMDAPEEVQEPIFNDTTKDGERRSFCVFNRALVEDPTISFPDSWPIIGGQKLKVWTPECWCGFAADPFGFIRISMKTPPLGLKNKYGTPEEQKVGWHTRQDMKTQMAKAKQDIADQKGKEKEFIGGWDPFWQEGLNPEALTRDQPVKKLSITAMGEVAAILQWKTDGYIPIYSAKDLNGLATLHVMAAIDYLYKQQFVAFSIPMIFTFGINFSIDVGVTADVTSPTFSDFFNDNISLDLSHSGFSITLGLIITMSIGAGVDGLCTISLRGVLTITFFIGFTGSDDQSLPLPHFVFSLGFVAQVVLQFLLFTQIWVPLPDLQAKLSDKEPLWDNWDGKQFKNWQNLGSDEPTSLYDSLTTNTHILTSDTLASHGEYTVDPSDTTGSEYVKLYLVNILESTTQNATTDDGTPYTLYVYVPVSQDRFAELRARLLQAMDQNDDSPNALADALAQVSTQDDSELIPVFGTPGNSLDENAELITFDGRYNSDRPVANVDSLGLLEGVHPTSDVTISQEVFSDPRSKMVSIYGKACMVRIASVVLSSGDARTRLVLQELPADGAQADPILLDFKLSVGRYPRYDYYDYEFDVIQTTTTDDKGNERCDLHLLVISGVREDDDETTIVGAAQGHVFSYVRYSFTNKDDLTERYATALQVTPDKIHATDCPDDWDNHIYLSPQIQLVEKDGQKACVMSYVERAGEDETSMLNDQNGDQTRVGVGMFFAKVEDGQPKEQTPVLSLPDLSDLREKLGSMNDLTLTSMSLTGMVSGYNTIKFGGRTAHYLLLDVTPAFIVQAATEGNDSNEGAAGIQQVLRVSDEAIAAVLTDPEETQLDLQEVLGQDFLLTCVNGSLQKVTWGDVESGDPKPVLEACGPEGTQIRSFTVDPTGEFIYWPTIADGDAPAKYDEYGQRLPDDPVKMYRIMACRMRNGIFSKAFTLAEQDGHPMDALRALENNYDGISFASTELVTDVVPINDTDLAVADAKANMWFTVVPHLRCLTVAYLSAEMAIVHVGDDVTFRIALRNDGNTYLQKCTIRFTTGPDEGAPVMAEHELVFSEENTLVSQWNPQDSEGKPTGVEPDYALAPGATSLYSVPGFTVPEDAPHDYYIYASVVEGSIGLAEMDGQTANADKYANEFLGTGYKTVASGERVLAGKTLTKVAEGRETYIDNSNQHSSNVTFKDNGDGGSSGGGASGGGTSGGGGSSPKTGDNTGSLGAVATALGAAGAAMVAYSRRRQRLERESRKGE